MRNRKKSRKKKAVKAPAVIKREPNSFLVWTVVYLALFILADVLTILYFVNQPVKPAPAVETPVPAEIKAIPYKNPEYEKLKSLPAGGKLEIKLPVMDRLKFTMSDEPVFDGADPVYSLNVCCPMGLSKDFYTAKMPWAFIMYDFEPGLPTVVLFEINSEKKTGRFEIVVLDSKANMETLKAVSVRIFTELVKGYMPGIEWKSSVRQEIN
jgi:hypothetical protein